MSVARRFQIDRFSEPVDAAQRSVFLDRMPRSEKQIFADGAAGWRVEILSRDGDAADSFERGVGFLPLHGDIFNGEVARVGWSHLHEKLEARGPGPEMPGSGFTQVVGARLDGHCRRGSIDRPHAKFHYSIIAE